MDKNPVREAPEDEDQDAPEDPPEKGPAPHPGHSFAPIRDIPKSKDPNIPSIVGDGPVNVRGPDERETNSGFKYLVAVFQFKEKEQAQNVRNDLLAGKFGYDIPKVDGPRGARTQKGTAYFTLSATVIVPDGTAPNELAQKLRARKAAQVEGPFSEGGRKRFELTVQKRSGATETLFFGTKDQAEAAKKQIEQGIRDNPVKGIAARRVQAGQSALAQRGLTKGQYFSDKSTQARKHVAMLKDDPDEAKSEIAKDLGLTLAVDPEAGEAGEEARMERMILKQKHGPEKMQQMVANAKAQLDDYLKKLKDSHQGGRGAGGYRDAAELEKLKPQFPGSFKGQVHTVKGRAQQYKHQYIDKKTGELKKGGGWREGKSSYEFVWDGEQWLTPIEYTSKRRGEQLPTRQVKKDEPAKPTAAGTAAVGGGGVTKKSGDKRIARSDPKYAEQYAKVLEAVGRHYMQSLLTKEMGEAMLAVVRTTRAKGSPTRQSLELFSRKLEELKEKFEAESEKMTPRGKENVMMAIDAGYRCLSQPPPEDDDYTDDGEPEQPDQDFAKAASKAARLGIAKGANEPKSIGKDFKPGRAPGRMHVNVAPGLPPKVAATIPRAYTKDTEDGWEELDYLLRGGDDSEWHPPTSSAAWTALRKSLSTPRKGDPADLKRSIERPWPPTRPPRKGPNSGGGDQPKDTGATQDTPWRALAKMRGTVPDKDKEEDPEEE